MKAYEGGTGIRHHAYAVGDADYHLPLLSKLNLRPLITSGVFSI